KKTLETMGSRGESDMGSRGESDEHFMFDPEYSPPNIVDLETHEVLASLAAAEDLTDDTDDSDVEITPPTGPAPTPKPRRKTTYGTASRKPMFQSTLDGGICSSSHACRKEKTVPMKSVIRGGRRKPKKKEKVEEIPEFDDVLEEVELDAAEIDLEDLENRQRSDMWTDFKVVEKPSGDLKVVCNHCKNEYAWYSHSHGTSGLRRHRLRCKIYPRNR
ncbi:hypothetical protein HID58_066634, partial [Brassica napus]